MTVPFKKNETVSVTYGERDGALHHATLARFKKKAVIARLVELVSFSGLVRLMQFICLDRAIQKKSLKSLDPLGLVGG